jgi:hypothetical protein
LRFVVGHDTQGGDAAVHIRGCDASPDVLTVAELLWDTWQAIPHIPRLAIAEHWGQRWGSPRITVADELDRRGFPADSVAVAWTLDDGHTFEFCGPILARMPCRLARAAIAHELGHVLQHALGLWHGDSTEREADACAAAWGFEIEAMRNFMRWHLLAIQLAR